MKRIFLKYKPYFRHKQFMVSFLLGILLLGLSFYVNFRAGNYATANESNAVTDVILSNIRVYDVDILFVEGFILFWIFVILLVIFQPQKIPYTLKSIALFVLIRSIFISLTHIGPFPNQILIDSTSIINKFSFGGDLFFSGHTGLPFLLALIFWENIYLRIAFIGASLLFGAVVLMGHLHYSIDVFAAFFITYTIHHIAEIIFKKDKKVFENGLV